MPDKQLIPLKTVCKATPMLGGVKEVNYFIAIKIILYAKSHDTSQLYHAMNVISVINTRPWLCNNYDITLIAA